MPEKEFHLIQKFHLTSDNFRIKLKGGTDVYEVKGNPTAFGSQSYFRTMDGKELASLEQTNGTKLSPWKKFVWKKEGKPWALAKQEDWGMMDKKEIYVDIPGENDYKIIGDRMSWNFKIMKGDVQVGTVDKKWGITDNYGIRVAEGADEVDVLLCGILIDQVYHDDEGK